MAAKDFAVICGETRLRRYEKSITLDGQSIYFEQPVTDRMWGNLIEVIKRYSMNLYNEGVDDTQKNIREAIGL